jgi:SPP1 gp7 family putative phage head morphogenesis protein
MSIKTTLRRNKKGGEKVKQPDNAPQAIIVQNIDVRPINRTTQDIPKWRQAIESAEARTPRRRLLTELYHDVILDAHVLAVTGKRQDAVTGANWQFVNKEGEAVDEINNLIDSIGFEDLTKEILNAKFWGYSIFEPKFYKNKDENWEMTANLLPRRHYYPQKGIVSYDGISEEGVNIREGIYSKTVLEAGEPNDLGLFASAAQYYVLKRGGIGDYAMYVQVFGRPIIDATWDGTDEEQRQKLKQALDIGAGGTIIRPDGTTIAIIESKGTQSTVHNDFYKAMNDEISKALLGTTETTTSSDSSGYAQAETHATSDNSKFKGDITFVRKVLNSRFIKILEAHGFDTEAGKFTVEVLDSTTDKEKITIINDLVDKHGLPIDDDYLYKTFNVPKPDDYDAQKKLTEENKPKPEDVNAKKPVVKDNLTTEEKPKKPNKAKEKPEDEKEVQLMAKWWEGFKSVFLTAPAKTGATNGKLHTINLSFTDTFNNDDFIQRVYDENGKLEFDTALFKSNLKALLNGFKTGWDKQLIKLDAGVGFEYNFNDPAMLTAFELNLFRFAGAKNLALVQQLNELFRNSTSFADFQAQASKITKIFNQDYLATEYNTALLTGESAALYHRLKGQKDVFPFWQYKTAADEHVRNSHVPLHNIILSADDPRWAKLFPPNGWNCRCFIKPLLANEVDASKLKAYQQKADAYLKSPAYAKEAAQGWGVNRGATGEIFTANQQYVNKFQDNSSSILSNLKPVNWGLQQYSNAKKVATANAPINQSTVDNVVNDLTDYNKRILQLDKNLFTDASNKVGLLDAMLATLKNPHEVWVQNESIESFIYLHYFKDKTIAVKAILKDLKLTINEVSDLENNKDLIKAFRKGLLAKS